MSRSPEGPTAVAPDLAAPPPSRRYVWLAVALVLLVLWFIKLPHRALAHPDEGRYAEISREMVATGDWLTPRVGGFKYLQKPPLQYWATAVAYEAFGASEWTARLWTALTGLAAVLVTWYAGRRLLGKDAADFGALALLASPYFVVMSGVNTLDMGVSLFLSSAVFAYLLSRQSATRAAGAGWMVVAWVAMALAVLSKGLIGVVLPFATLVAYAVWHRQPQAMARLCWLPGLAIFAAMTVPWFVLAARANAEFLEFFFLREHLQRFTSTVHQRAGPIWYFVPILALAVTPWIVPAAAGLARAWRSPPEGGAISARRFLLLWCAVVFAFFSVSQSKLPAYLLPIVPALALLAGDALAGGVGLYRVHRTHPRRLIVALLAASYLATSLGMVAYGQLAPTRSAAAFAAQIKRLGPADAPVYAVQMYDHTLPFYLGRLVTVAAFTGELEPGIRADPQQHIPTLEAFRARWLAEANAFAVMPPDAFEALRRDGLPMTLLATEPKKVLVRKPSG